MQSVLYVTSLEQFQEKSLIATMAIFEWLQLPRPTVVDGVNHFAKMSSGKFNPLGDWLIATADGAKITNPVEVCEWANKCGIVPI